jgi:gliding motility-associated-like protein
MVKMKRQVYILILTLGLFTGKISGQCTGDISPGSSTICYNTSPGIFTATGGGSLAYTYLWFKNGIFTGITDQTYDPGILTETSEIYCKISCAGGGQAISSTSIITVTPNASIGSVSGTSPLCISGTANYSANSVVLGGGSGAWSSNNITIATVNSSSGLVTGVSAGSCDIIYTITGGCGGTISAQQSVTISPNASIASVSGTSPLCISGTANYTANSVVLSGGAGAWSSSAAAIATVNSLSGLVTAVSAGSCNIIYTITGGCGGTKSAQKSITVRPDPSATISGTITVCQNDIASNVTFTNPQNLSIIVTYNINGTNQPTINVAANNTATITAPTNNSGTFDYNLVSVAYQSGPSCSNVVSGIATITVAPTVGTPSTPTPSASTICQGSDITTYTTSATDAASYHWSVTGTGNSISGSGSSGTVTWGSAYSGTATVSVTATGCGTSAPASTTVTVRPTPTASISGTTTVCQNATAPHVTFTNQQNLAKVVTYNINGINPTTIVVDANNTATVAAPTNIPGTFDYNLVSVVYQSGISCSNVVSGIATITITPIVGVPAFLLGTTSTRCQGAGIVTYSAVATNTTGITYNLDAASIAAGNSIVSATGAVTFAAGWSGTTLITATAAGCGGPMTAIHTVTITPTVGTPSIPTPSATIICQGSANTSYSTSAINAIGYNWSVTGNGNSITTGTPTGTVTWAPGFSGIATVSVTANGCNGPSASAFTTVTVRPAPTATISGTTTVCQNASSPIVTFSNPLSLPIIVTYNINGANQTTIAVGAGTFAIVAAPTSNAGTFVYNLVSSDYQTAPICTNSISGAAIITVSSNPTPTLTSSVPGNVFCAGTSVTFTAGGGTNYTFIVAGTIRQSGTSASYTTSTLTNGQQVYVNVTNANGCSANSASIQNIVNPLPFYDISSSPSCSSDLSTYSLAVKVFATGNRVTSTAGTVTNTGNNIWSISGVPAGTNITVTVSDGSCESIFPVTAPTCSCPVVNAPVSGGDKSYCELQSIPTINATVLTGETVDWYGSLSGGTLLRSTSLTYTPLAAGTYYALARNIASGCVSSTRTAVSVIMNLLPTPTLTSSDPDNSFCAGTSVTFTAGGGGVNYNFMVQGTTVQNGPSATYTTRALINGQIVSVFVMNSNGCSITSPGITNTVYPIPVPNAGTGGSGCDLNFNLKAVQGIGVGTWTKTAGAGTATFTPNIYSATATVTVSEFGTYTFTWTEDRAGCSGSASINVNFYQQPVANPGTGGNNCGKESTLKALPSVGTGTWSKTAGPGTAIFTPNANSPNAKVAVSLFGQYTFTWTEINGICSNSASASLNFFEVPSANAGVDGSECDLDFILKAVQGTGSGTWAKVSGPGTVIFSPDSHQPGAKVTVSQSGIYDFSWTEVSSICQSSDIVRVTFRNLPSVSAGRDTVICKGASVQLNAKGVGSFKWDPNTLTNNPLIYNPVVTPLATTSFIVTLTDQYGCKNVDTVMVGVTENPIADAGPDQELDYLLETTMNATLANVIETGNWSLVTGTGTISDASYPKTSISGLSLGMNKFLWTVTNKVCPSSSDTVNIFVSDFFIPTLITPNLDGKNDNFVLKGLSTLGKTELVIFDRRGVRVYQNSDYDNSWDGVDYNNNPLPDDTYFYVLKSNIGKSMSGYIVIRR